MGFKDLMRQQTSKCKRKKKKRNNYLHIFTHTVNQQSYQSKQINKQKNRKINDILQTQKNMQRKTKK